MREKLRRLEPEHLKMYLGGFPFPGLKSGVYLAGMGRFIA